MTRKGLGGLMSFLTENPRNKTFYTGPGKKTLCARGYFLRRPLVVSCTGCYEKQYIFNEIDNFELRITKIMLCYSSI